MLINQHERRSHCSLFFHFFKCKRIQKPPGSLRAWMLEEFIRASLFYDVSFVNEDHPVRDRFGKGHLVCGRPAPTAAEPPIPLLPGCASAQEGAKA